MAMSMSSTYRIRLLVFLCLSPIYKKAERASPPTACPFFTYAFWPRQSVTGGVDASRSAGSLVAHSHSFAIDFDVPLPRFAFTIAEWHLGFASYIEVASVNPSNYLVLFQRRNCPAQYDRLTNNHNGRASDDH